MTALTFQTGSLRDAASVSLWDKVLLASLAIPLTMIGSKYLLLLSGRFVPELFFAFWTPLAWHTSSLLRHYMRKILLGKRFLIVVSVVSFIALLGLFDPQFSFVSFWGRYRALLLAVLGFFVVVGYVKSANFERSNTAMCWLFVPAALSFSVTALLSYKMISLGGGVKHHMSSFSFFVALICLADGRKLRWLAIVFSALVVASVLSFFRQNYVASVLALLFLMQYSYFSSGSLSWRKVFLATAFWIAVVILFTLMLSTLSNLFFSVVSVNESSYIQSVGKMNDLISGIDGSADSSTLYAGRDGAWNYFGSNLGYFLLPNGIMNDATTAFESIFGSVAGPLIGGASPVRDGVFMYLFVTFGVIIALPLIFAQLSLAVRKALGRHQGVAEVMVLELALLAQCLTDGGNLTSFEKAFFFGAFIAFATFPSRRFGA